MPFDHSKLRGRIIEKYGSIGAFSAAVGIAKSSVSSKLNNRVSIGAEEMMRWSQSDILDIPAAEISAYFLTPKVR